MDDVTAHPAAHRSRHAGVRRQLVAVPPGPARNGHRRRQLHCRPSAGRCMRAVAAAATAPEPASPGWQLGRRRGAVHLCGCVLLRLPAAGHRRRRPAAVRRSAVEHAAVGVAARRTPGPLRQSRHRAGHGRPARPAAARCQRTTTAGGLADAAGRSRLGRLLAARTRPGQPAGGDGWQLPACHAPGVAAGAGRTAAAELGWAGAVLRAAVRR
ncbi:UNVERIFIED_CONTAM: hypothetical protein NCL1_63605, partial [Trichonephila clavipes]